MEFLSSFSENAVAFVSEHQILTALLTPLFGEVGIGALGFLAGSGAVSVSVAFVIPLLTMVLYDLLLLFLVRVAQSSMRGKRLLSWFQGKGREWQYHKTVSCLKEKFETSPIAFLFLLKIFPGTRLLIILYLLLYKPSMPLFTVQTLITTALWLLVLLAPSFAVGFGSSLLFIQEYAFWIVMVYVVSIFLAFYFFSAHLQSVYVRITEFFIRGLWNRLGGRYG